MNKIHFEIGHVKNRDIERTEDETESVFRSELLSECIKEFKDRGYVAPEYFIDIWEQDADGIPYPLADIKLENWVFA